MANFQNLRFFNGTENELNLLYNEDNYWEGTVHLPEVSVGLYESFNLFILEEVIDSVGTTFYSTPISDLNPSSSFNFEWEDDRNSSKDIILYGTKVENNVVKVQQLDSVNIDVLDQSVLNAPPLPGGIKEVAQYFNNALQINVALTSANEEVHHRVLKITDDASGEIVAKIKIYGETVGEDERLRDLLQNFGATLDDGDFIIFKEHDINEYSPDWMLMNQKRKELLLELHNIKPFIGTYKAILNAIDFFGYNNITLKEYWLNINQNSDSFGKLKAVPVPDTNTGFSYKKRKKFNLPSSTMKKTSRFSLVYKLNKPDGTFDNWDIPNVEEVFDFAPEEILIKLYGLKNKLQKEYLPLQAKIVDITGEGDFFDQKNINTWNNQEPIWNYNEGKAVDFEIYPKDKQLFVESYALVNSSNLLIGATGHTRVELDEFGSLNKKYVQLNTIANATDPNADYITVSIVAGYRLRIRSYEYDPGNPDNPLSTGLSGTNLQIGDFVRTDTGEFVEILNIQTSSGNLLIDIDNVYVWNSSYEFNDEAIATSAPGTQTGISTIVQSFSLQGANHENEIMISDFEEFYDQYYTDSKNVWNDNLLGHYDIPVGAPLILECTSLPQDWDNAKFTWGDAKDPQINWNNWWKQHVYEMEWIITGPKNYKQSYKGKVGYWESDGVPAPNETLTWHPEFLRLAIMVPYSGDYSVELKLIDLYGFTSHYRKDDMFNVKVKPLELYGIYQWKDIHNWNTWKSDWGSSGGYWDLPTENLQKVQNSFQSLYLTMDRANYLHDLSQGRRFSLVRRYIDYDPTNPTGYLETEGPYQWSELETVTWNHGKHNWWNATRIGMDLTASFKITEIYEENILVIEHFNPITKQIEIGSHTIQQSTPANNFDLAAWQLVADELNQSTDPVISKFNYNPVYEDTNNDGTNDVFHFILCVGKNYSEMNDFETVTIDQGIGLGTGVVMGEVHYVPYNPTFDTVRIINGSANVERSTHVTVSYDKSEMPGIRKMTWKIFNDTNPNFNDIYYDNMWLTYVFKNPGAYRIALEVEDTNGNKNSTERNMIFVK